MADNTIAFRIKILGKSETAKKIGEIDYSLKKLSQQQKDLVKNLKAGTITEQAYTKSLGESKVQVSALRQEKRKLNLLVRQEINSLQANEGSMAALRAETAKLSNTVNRFRVGVDGTSNDLERLKGQLRGNRERIIDWDKDLKSGKTSVGLYGDAIKNTLPGLGQLGSMLAGGVGAAAAAQIFVELGTEAGKAVQEIVKEFKVLRGELALLSGETGDALDNIVVKTDALSKAFDQDAKEISKSANVLAKTFGISFDEALGLIQDGFKNGAKFKWRVFRKNRRVFGTI